MYICIYIHKHRVYCLAAAHVTMYISIYIYIYIYIHGHVYVYIYICVYIHMKSVYLNHVRVLFDLFVSTARTSWTLEGLVDKHPTKTYEHGVNTTNTYGDDTQSFEAAIRVARTSNINMNKRWTRDKLKQYSWSTRNHCEGNTNITLNKPFGCNAE